MQMKICAAKAIANLVKEPITEELKESFGNLTYEENYIIPIPFDKKLMIKVSSAVVFSAVESGVARVKDFDLEKYKEKLISMI